MSEYKLVPVELTDEMVEASGCEGKFKVSPHEQAQEMWETMLAAAPTVQGEPVAVMYEDGSLLSKADCGDNFEICCKVQTPLYTAPQPAPDVVELVEALEELVDLMEDIRQGEYTPDSFTTQPARIALAAYRKGGEA